MAWYDEAVFYHIYPLGLTGAPKQNAYAALSVANYAYILEVGRVVLEGPGRELLEDPKVKEAYLGG